MAKEAEKEKQDAAQAQPVKEKAKAPEQKKVEAIPMEDTLEALMDYGGFDLIKVTISSFVYIYLSGKTT